MAECIHLLDFEICSLCLGLEEFDDPEWERKDYVQVNFVDSERVEDELTLEVEESAPEFVDEEELRKFGDELRIKSQKGNNIMGLRMATPNVYLSEFKGEIVALRFNDLVYDVETNWGKVNVPRADIVRLSGEGDDLKATFEGQGLVFQKAIANSITGNTDWVIGRLEQVERPTEEAADATMYQLSDPGLPADRILEAFNAAAISV